MPAEGKCPQCGAVLAQGALAGLCPACLLAQGAAIETATQPGAQFQPPTVEEVAKLFPQLQVLAFIGKGGMGAVYQARQPALDRVVALKILPARLAGGPEFAGRFNREARALAKLNHPNIVAVYEFGQADGMPFFIMEFVDGLNLRQLERAGKLSSREALQIVPQICEALQFAHDEGIVHRDIKPENILLDKKGRVKIADFGIAKLMGGDGGAGSPLPAVDARTDDGAHGVTRPTDALTEAGKTIGTPNYMAPEQVQNPQEVDHRADIYSLGVVFYEMLTGELPLGKFAPPSRKVTVDVRLDEVVLRALEKEPERRYQQASEVKTMVETIATDTLGQTRKTPQNTEPVDARTWSPFQSPRLREICAHMTDEEKSHSARRGMFWGIWCAVSCFAFIFGVNFSLHAETALMLGVGFVIVQILAVTTWRRMQRQFLASTEWARQQGIEARTLPLFSFSLKGIALTGMRDGMREPNWIGIATAFVVVFAIMALVTIMLWLSARRDFHLVATLGIAFGLSMAVVAGGVVRALGRGWKAAVLWVILIPFVIGAFIAIKALEAPRAVDAMLFVQSPAGQLEASGCTIGAMRVFGGDNYIYRFQIRNSDGKILRTTEVPIPFQNDKLRTDPNAAPGSVADYYFGGNGRIDWAPDGSAVTFSMRGVELAHLQVDRFAVPATGGASGTRASAETWSPPGGTGPTLSEKVKKAVGQFSAPPPAVKVDPSKILSEAKQLAAQGQYEEALQRHIWYHNHALEQDPAQAGVRLSYALSDWGELGRKYPKAMRALVEIRDQDTARFATNGGYFALFMDVNSLNKNLQDEPATARLFKQIDKQDPALARQCYPVVESLLVQQGEYELCGKYVGDPDAAFDRIKGNWDMLRSMVRAPAGFADNQFVTKVCQLIEILNHTGHEVEAGKIRERARAVVDDSRLRADKEQQSGPMSAFGPPIERMIYSVATQKPIKGQDFDSGTEIEVPDEVAKSGEDKFFEWIAEHGIDMMAFGHKASWDLWTPLKLASMEAVAWETADVGKIRAALDSGLLKLDLVEKSTFSGFRTYSVKTNSTLPMCLAFKTQKGGLGVMEIAGFSESPVGVRIRYRLAQKGQE